MSALTDKGYTEDWRAVAYKIKERAAWRCVRCGHEHDVASGYCLTVHHIDGDKQNNAWWNLAALCQRCHLKVQATIAPSLFDLVPSIVSDRDRVEVFAEWFRPYIAGYYARRLNVIESKYFVFRYSATLINAGLGSEQALADLSRFDRRAVARPVRLQRSRKRGARLPVGAICVTRGTRFGNEYRIGDTHVESGRIIDDLLALELYRRAIESDQERREDIKRTLRGRALACFCQKDDLCHADYLIEVANE